MPATAAHSLTGVLPVVQVPFDARWCIDWDVYVRQIEWAIDQGANGLVLAMVSEVTRLSDEERHLLFARTVRAARGRVPVVASVGAESTAYALRHLRIAVEAGVDAVMATPPALTACDQRQLIDYYSALLEASELPVVVQDSSGYMGRPVSLDTQVELFQRYGQRVMFKPEAPPVGQHLTALLERAAGATVFDGLGGLMLIDHHARGARGVMPAADLVWATSALWQSLETGNIARATAIHAPLAAIVNLMVNLDAFLAIIKLFLVQQGVFVSDRVRGPVGYQLDPTTRDRALRLLRAVRETVDSAATGSR